MSDSNSPRERLYQAAESFRFQIAINALIVINAITLGMETSPTIMNSSAGPVIKAIEAVILGVFVFELVIKLIGRGHRFFYDPWNIFDFIVVGISLIPAAGPFAVLRALRVLRILRLLKTIPRLRAIVESTLRVLPDLAWVFLLLLLVFYVFAVIGTKLFAVAHPDFFGNLGKTMFTLFQVMTLESWSMGVARVVMGTHPYAWIYFVCFILLASFLVLNMVIGVVVNGFQGVLQGEEHEPGIAPVPEHAKPMDIEQQILDMQRKLDELLTRK